MEGLTAGIGEVLIAPGTAKDLIEQLLSGVSIGTKLVLPVVGVAEHV